MGRPPRGARRSCAATRAHLSPAAARLATLPAGHPQGYADCFDLFVADVYAAIRGEAPPTACRSSRDGLRAAQITDAVLASAREERWVDVPAVEPAGGDVMSAAVPVLEVRGLVKEYPGVKALQGVDLDVLEGEVHCLLGPNGAGKSTLIKCVSGAVEPTAGEILFRGEPLPVRRPRRLARRRRGDHLSGARPRRGPDRRREHLPRRASRARGPCSTASG